MKYFFLFLLAPFCFTSAQVDSIFVKDAKDFLNVSANFYTSPFRFDSEDWIEFSAMVGLTGLATLTDKDVRNFSQRNKSDFANDVFSIDKYFYTEFVGASIIGLYGYGLIDNNNSVRKLAVKLTEATFLATSLTVITKTVVGRGRPYKQECNYYTDPFSFDNDYNSFPSGHTTLAFAYSTVMANEIDNIFWKVGWYAAAGLVGYSRIYHNQHWVSDVLMGAAIGYFSGEFVDNHETNKNEKTKISLYPFPGGLALQLSF
ncbi:MAG: phosphatase PAP2 family protein [Ignavibacteriales bacterium]|nr:phosphatase PAP2 family protein [Ignavibacteriales bacterium]